MCLCMLPCYARPVRPFGRQCTVETVTAGLRRRARAAWRRARWCGACAAWRPRCGCRRPGGGTPRARASCACAPPRSPSRPPSAGSPRARSPPTCGARPPRPLQSAALPATWPGLHRPRLGARPADLRSALRRIAHMRCVMRPSADPRRTAEPALRGRPQAAARGAHAAGRLARAGGAFTVRALPRRGRRAAEPLARQARAARAAAPARRGAGSPPGTRMGAWVQGRAGTAVCGPGCECTLGALWATGPLRVKVFSSSEAASAYGLCCARAPRLPACVRLDWCGLACSPAAALLELARAARLPPAGARGWAAAAAGQALRARLRHMAHAQRCALRPVC